MFKTKIVDIKEVELPELNDEFASNLSEEFKGLDDLKKRIKEDLTKQEESRIEKELQERLVKKMAENLDFELPDCLVEQEINMAIDQVKQNLQRAGLTPEKAGLDDEKLKIEFKPMSENKVKNMLILGEVARLEDVDTSEEDISEGFKKMADGIGQPSDVIRKYYEANNLMDSFKEMLQKEKTLSFLVENAKVTETTSDNMVNKLD